MAEMILPGVYIDVRAEGLISPGRVTVGNLGVVGTASKGPILKPILLSNIGEAREFFGAADAYDPAKRELTLVRALDLAFSNGASTVYAVRVTPIDTHAPKRTPNVDPDEDLIAPGLYTKAQKAAFDVISPPDTDSPHATHIVAHLRARYHGTWGNDISINITKVADDDERKPISETVNGPAAGSPPLIKLKRKHIDPARKNQIVVLDPITGLKTVYVDDKVVYKLDDLVLGKVFIDTVPGEVHFVDPDKPNPTDRVTTTYFVDIPNSRKVSIKSGGLTETYIVVDGKHLVDQIKQSELVEATETGDSDKLPEEFSSSLEFRPFSGFRVGSDGDGASDADYKPGLATLEDEAVHIVVAAGMDNEKIADELQAHCEKASTDKLHGDRIAVVGSKLAATTDDIRNKVPNSDRIVFVAPGFKVTDSVSGNEVTLPGAYTAAIIAGMLASRDPEVSLTNKSVSVSELETRYNSSQLEQLVQAKVLVLEQRRGLGIRVVKGITTDGGAFKQITTRRIVDYAKYGVRSAADPYIGLLNNERVRGALRATINSFLTDMIDDEMLIKYDLDVTASRAQEIRGIVQVTMTLQPVFSIDFIKVTLFLT
jgi:hypothetical protein